MKKLLQLYRGLPREVQMMVAMAGLGTPLGAIYILQRFLFPGMPLFFVILIVGGAVLGICLLAFLLSRIFGRGKRKRGQKLAADLAADAEGGMAAVDVRAAIKANNEKFFTAIREMRKSLGISVYDLPWYIVLGDSGCGKTKLINEGGLTFSTGKPEGYQLGTLNYNWWFTEDAIFVDMAGRLCNPKDDADRREWEAFLATVGKGRKGYPINGALVCISADHLLQDPPEKIEQVANTTLERLRDLQNKLGVTFATYLVITKCDKIVGFMQYFDRAERDITIKNQIFGMSRPGVFNELYDPETFKGDFDTLYGRLNDLRLRRMNDDADEGDLGLAYSFPEEFRELREPLQTYVRTLFPMIKNPRAVKNLIYRGAYFTSATQEGQLILKHLTERLGPEAGAQFQSLDLYPNKRPHFIKDVLFRKVFPEHGLVFRNEEEALRKRKWAKMLKVASIVLGVGLVGTLAASSVKFNGVIGTPRVDAQRLGPTDETTPDNALVLTSDLSRDISSLEENRFWAALLSWGVGTHKPVEHLKTIQAGIFEKRLLRQVLLDVGEALRSAQLAQLPWDDEGRQKAAQYMDALEQYVVWVGCAGEQAPPEHLTLEGLRAMGAVVEDPETFVRSQSEHFWDQAANYFNVIRGEVGNWQNPALALRDGAMQTDDTVRQGVVQVHEYLKRYAELTDRHPDPLVREWIRLRTQCTEVETTYTAMLDLGERDPETREALLQFKDTFVTSYDRFSQALDGCKWQGEQSGPYMIIKPLRDALLAQREVWIAYQQKLTEAHARCPSPPESTIPASIAALQRGSQATGLPGLDRVLWESLKTSRLAEIDYHEGNFDEFQNLVREVPDEYAPLLTLVPGGGTTHDRIVLTEGAVAVRDILRGLRDKLVAAPLDPDADPGTPEQWVEDLFAVLGEADKELASTVDVTKFDEYWRPDDLALLDETQQYLISRGVATQLLAGINARLGRVGSWGLAELASDEDFLGKQPSVYRIALPTRSEENSVERRDKPKEDEEEEADSKRPRKRTRRTRRRASSSSSPRATESPGERESGLQIPICATSTFLLDRSEECINLQLALRDFDESLYFPGESDNIPLHEACLEGLEDAAQTYFQAYVRAWGQAYKAKELGDLERLLGRARDWQSLSGMMRSQGAGSGVNRDDVGDEFRQSLVEILSALPFWTTFQDDNGEWTQADLKDPDWQDVAYWWGQAVDSWWPSDQGRFAERARVPREVADAAPGEPAAQSLADEFVRRWRVLADGIAAAAELPRRFEQPPSQRDKRGIPWGDIEALRQEARLDDEKLTGQFVVFERRAQELLSEELTDILCSVQDRYFGREHPFDGWPYLSPGGEELNALETVKFADFTNFLVEISNARQAFEPIEATIPKDDRLARERDAFYRSCEEWRTFLRLGDDRVAGELAVEVSGGDPVMPPYGKERVQDTAQHYYEAVELDLGLAVSATGDSGRPLRVATLYEEKVRSQKCVWRWSGSTGGGELSVSLVDGWQIEGSSRAYPAVKRVLGQSSPLALCAYLHRYGVPDDGKWLTVHKFDLVEALKRQGQSDLVRGLKTDTTIVGEKFVFNLVRPLPNPIGKLERSASGAADDR
ncbi:MAG TPA: type VI secretion protein IcmF/TssM N-terminal domain-containing protein [Phycisphaerae bacterium]|nr:type VI secretion protein IcmF/TssM N-terminal domain-containing protein [Phycisphaerae bacterium]